MLMIMYVEFHSLTQSPSTVQLKFLLDKNFVRPIYPCITEIICGINFRPCGKDCHRFYQEHMKVLLYMYSLTWYKKIAG